MNGSIRILTITRPADGDRFPVGAEVVVCGNAGPVQWIHIYGPYSGRPIVVGPDKLLVRQGFPPEGEDNDWCALLPGFQDPGYYVITVSEDGGAQNSVTIQVVPVLMTVLVPGIARR